MTTLAPEPEFEIVSDHYRFGTSKLYSRSDFLPLDDARAMSEGDFVGRLRALFGAVDGDDYVLRHRESGFIVTAYSAQSGPSYGGGAPLEGELPDSKTRRPSHAGMVEAQMARQARIEGDPVLAAGPPVNWSAIDLANMTQAEVDVLRGKDRKFHRRLKDVSAPPGLGAVIERLNELLESVEPVDWEVHRYYDDPPTVYRVGAEGGEDFSEALDSDEGLLHLLASAEEGSGLPEATYPGNADDRVLSYWAYHRDRGESIEPLRPRVQATWFRFVAGASTSPAELRERLLEYAGEMVEGLGIDRRRAAAALQGSVVGDAP